MAKRARQTHGKFNTQRRNKMIQFLVHEKADSVGVATVDIKAGETIQGLFMDSQKKIEIKVLDNIPLGHKIALTPMKAGATVLKYGHDIGEVSASFEKGTHVHVQNLKTKRW
jgi:(2R)-sulfolactate sulfo-lyase subunit alpha